MKSRCEEVLGGAGFDMDVLEKGSGGGVLQKDLRCRVLPVAGASEADRCRRRSCERCNPHLSRFRW